MNRECLIRTVIEGQSAGGAFLSFVHHAGSVAADRNGFTTALVLRALAKAPETGALRDARRRALDFLEACESPDRPGAFGFWPRQDRPAWAVGVTEDADDTAVISLELYRHGRRSRQDLRRTVCNLLLRHQLGDEATDLSPWVKPGVFLTWLRRGMWRNPVDCCVNANVLALMAAVGLTHLPGYAEGCVMIAEGIAWAAHSRERMRSLTPYYPDPRELPLALDHAVRAGATDLSPALRQLRENPQPLDSHDDSSSRPLYANPEGSVVWTSPILDAARLI